MTSAAIAPSGVDEPVSPELALVDPDLAARLRALLPVIELEPPPPALRALPDPEPEDDLLRAPPPELLDGVATAAAPPVPTVVRVAVHPSRGDRLRSFAKAFAAGAAVATLVTVGVVAKLGESGPTEAGPVSVPPVVPPTANQPASGAAKAATTPGSKSAARSGTAAPAKARKKGNAAPAKPTRKAKTTKPAQSARQKQTPQTSGSTQRKGTAPPAEPRRFAWAPVAGALGYRVELFRGDRQVLRESTKQPTFELGAQWRHQGRVERLTPGSYRWYVWPVLRSGAAAKAIVQARLTVP